VIFFDTNVLIYYSINQDDAKQKLSCSLIEDAIKVKKFYISPLVFSEYIYALAKLNMLDISQPRINLFSNYVKEISSYKGIVLEASTMCKEIDFCKHINDVIHLKTAEQGCQKLVTFDSDFKKLQKHTNIEIEIIK